jgi:hypothetical protein
VPVVGENDYWRLKFESLSLAKQNNVILDLNIDEIDIG